MKPKRPYKPPRSRLPKLPTPPPIPGSGRSSSRFNPKAMQRLWGIHAVREALANPDRSLRQLWMTEAGEKALGNWPLPEGLEFDRVEKGKLDRLLPAGAVHQGLALDAEPMLEPSIDDLGRAAAVRGGGLIVALDRVTDPHNVGAILRAAAAFGAQAVIAPQRHSPDITGTLAKAASGALEHVPYCRPGNFGDSLARLQGVWHFTLLGLDETAMVDLPRAPPAERTVLVLGAEGEGLRARTRGLCDLLVGLPTPGPIKALNVATAAAVALYARRVEI